MRAGGISGARMPAGGCPRGANFFKKVFYRNRVPYEKLIYPDPTIFVRVVFFHIIMALSTAGLPTISPVLFLYYYRTRVRPDMY